MKMKKKVIDLATVEPICNDCKHYISLSKYDGICNANAPQATLDSSDNVITVRPIVDLDAPACGQFRGKH